MKLRNQNKTITMNIEDVREYCLKKAGVSEGCPFGPNVLVLKVMSKMFATLSLDADRDMNLKCDPEKSLELRDEHEFVVEGYHMNKKHWNTIKDVQAVDEELLSELIDHSYELVEKGLKKGEKEELKLLKEAQENEE